MEAGTLVQLALGLAVGPTHAVRGLHGVGIDADRVGDPDVTDVSRCSVHRGSQGRETHGCQQRCQRQREPPWHSVCEHFNPSEKGLVDV